MPDISFVRRRRKRTRGQSVVEFALVVPVLLLLLLIAIDFGRVFLGWVALNNAAGSAQTTRPRTPIIWDCRDGLRGA